MREVQGSEPVKGNDGSRKRASEDVVIEEEGFEVDQAGEIGDWASERVSFEAQDPELVQAVETAVGESAVEAVGFKNESNDSGLRRATDARPAAVAAVGRGAVDEESEAVAQISLRFEGQQRRRVR